MRPPDTIDDPSTVLGPLRHRDFRVMKAHLQTSEKKEAPPLLGESVYIRDRLAEYRTGLALKRTLLSYFRTALAFFGGGLAMIKFSGHPLATILGWSLLPAGVTILVQGCLVYMRMKRALEKEQEIADRAERGEL